jgi:hypothetical protein
MKDFEIEVTMQCPHEGLMGTAGSPVLLDDL